MTRDARCGPDPALPPGAPAALVAALFHTAAAGVAVLDRELRYVRVNAALAAMNGVPPAAHEGRCVRDVIPHDVADALEPLLRRVLTTGEPAIDLPFDAESPRGRRRFVASCHAVRDASGEPAGVVALVAEQSTPTRDGSGDAAAAVVVFENIAEQREREAAERATRLQSLTAALAGTRTVEEVADVVVAQAVAATGAMTGMLVVRPSGSDDVVIVRQTGFPTETLPPHLRFRADLQSPAAQALRTGEPVWVSGDGADTLEARFPDVAHVWRRAGSVAVASVPLAVAGANVGAMSFTWATPHATPLEEREFFLALGRQAAQAVERARLFAAEREARERAERLQALTAALARARTLDDVATVVVAEMVVALGARTGAMAVRERAGDDLVLVRHVGFPPEAAERVQRQPIASRGPVPECFRTAAPIWLESREGPDGFDARYPALTGVWDTLGVASAAYVPLIAAGEAVGVISFSFAAPRTFGPDARAFLLALGQQAALAVERARLFEAERAARQEAEAANRSKSEFLAVMSHELRTPLNAIGGYAELLEMGVRGPVTEQQRADLARIQASQRHLLRLINEVLSYARLETGSVRYDLAPVHVRDALVAAEGLIAPQARAKGLTLTVADVSPRLMVRADEDKLRQILANLLSNAVKFTDRGGTVDLSAEARVAGVAIHVRDTGIGIAADKLGVIFEPFVQVRGDLTRTAEGAGLGLAISRDLARGMGGELSVVSAPGEGSTFTVTLPAP